MEEVKGIVKKLYNSGRKKASYYFSFGRGELEHINPLEKMYIIYKYNEGRVIVIGDKKPVTINPTTEGISEVFVKSKSNQLFVSVSKENFARTFNIDFSNTEYVRNMKLVYILSKYKGRNSITIIKFPDIL